MTRAESLAVARILKHKAAYVAAKGRAEDARRAYHRQIRAAYAAGLPVRSIATSLGVTVARVRQMMEETNGK